MPIYEYYCKPCHTIYNFYSRAISNKKQPTCPVCGKKKLSRQVSLFSAIGSAKETDEMDDLSFDEAKMEQAMMAVAAESENMPDDDPAAAAQMMRKMSQMTGLQFNDSMEYAIARMEAGEDPDQIEKEMGDLFSNDECPFVLPGSKKSTQKRPPKRDETLYDL